MIERLRIRNFQVHEDLDLKLAPVVTIVGRNDSGKSSIIRAIRWVLFNQPRGDKFIRWGETTATVALKIDGKTVKRERSKSTNAYHFDGEKFTSFDANAVPKTIADFLNVGPDNAQEQDSPSFWFSDTAGEVAKKLNAVINLTEIDDALEFAASETRKAKNAVGFTEERLKEAEEELAGLEWVPRFDAALTELEQLEAELQTTTNIIYDITNLVESGDRLNTERKRLDAAHAAGTELIRLGDVLGETYHQRCGLEALVATITSLESQLVDPPDLSEVIALREAATAAGQRRAEMEHWVLTGEQLEEELCLLDQELSEAEAQLSKMGASRCPTCGQFLRRATSP